MDDETPNDVDMDLQDPPPPEPQGARTSIAPRLEDEQAGTAGAVADIIRYCAGEKRPLRMRLNLTIWDPEKGQYVAWKGQSWKVEVTAATPEGYLQEARANLELITAALERAARFGNQSVIDLLES